MGSTTGSQHTAVINTSITCSFSTDSTDISATTDIDIVKNNILDSGIIGICN